MVYISYNQARECVVNVFNKRGYQGGKELIELLTEQDLIVLNDRSKLMEFINTLQLQIDKDKKEKKFAREFKK